LKIIFNHRLNNWYWQIADELKRNHEIIIPENYKKKENVKDLVDLDALEKCVRENRDSDFIFDFRASIYDLIRWKNRKIDIPIVVFAVNALMRPYVGKKTVFTYVWYVERYAKDLMEQYRIENLIYLGMAANPYQLYPIKIEKIYDIGFIGRHYGERAYWLNKVHKFCIKNNLKFKLPLSHGEELFLSQNDINRLYNNTKINLSFAPIEPPGRIVNLRTYEICMSGNFQLMQYTPCVEEIFELDKEIVCWKDKNDLFEKILYYLENEDEREKIAKNGYKRAINNYTWTKRIEEIAPILMQKKKILDITKAMINLDKILEPNDFAKIQNLDLEPNDIENYEFIKYIFKKKKYKIKRDIKNKTRIEINSKDYSFYFKPNLTNVRFIQIYGKIMMIIKYLPLNSKLDLTNWDKVKKILYLTENIDLTLPQFGVLTNGFEWIIRDFKNRKWLKILPTRNDLKARLNAKSYFILKIIQLFKNYFRFFNFHKKLPSIIIRKNLKILLNYSENIIRKILKSPQPQKFN